MITNEMISIIRDNNSIVISYTVPIVVYKSDARSPNEYITGGTGVLVDTGEMKLLLSAGHVFEEIENLKSKFSIFAMIGIIDGEPLDISGWRILFNNKDIDLCAIEIPMSFDPSIIKKEFHRPAVWPPSRVKAGDNIFIGGFPAEKRSANNNGLNCGYVSIPDLVYSVSDDRITVADNDEKRESIALDGDTSTITSFGGMSGSPMFKFTENSIMEIAGIFIVGGCGTNATFWGVHADFVKSSGDLDANIIPYRNR